ncbi:Putative protein [Zobellia galactanivorans]|uniref:Uncharacterized protein n=1 Tax=Zobellia galactanivorans (strain DSM 12802 / CCUG 47099 / CIP 106680 / NCIMB 13871 / Dsij) TaxID=63186 RepID=G0LBF5_ZOBGA|nr:Putative protein [Zobellia galactanivorans]
MITGNPNGRKREANGFPFSLGQSGSIQILQVEWGG